MARAPVIVAWSGGKDCTLALHDIVRGDEYEPAALLTTVTGGYDRISMHGVRRSLLQLQASALGVPLHEVTIAPNADNDEYEKAMARALSTLRTGNPAIAGVVFGDLFLRDIREYRERQLARAELRAIFPLWERDTREMAARFIELGFRAVVVCVDSTQLDGSFAGREFDASFVADLPDGVDPCGENGEFHTFVYDGPLFATPIAHERGEIVVRDGRFHYAELLDIAASKSPCTNRSRPMTFQLTSSVFEAGGPIPARYTCDSDDVSPPLSWSGAPDGTRSFAMIVDDPDAPDPKAPKMVYVHWVMVDIPPATTSLAEHTTSKNLPAGAREGRNDWKNIGYGGPCPPIGRHRYFFKLYALDTTLPDLKEPTKPELESAMKGHILAQTELMGTYDRGATR